MARSSVAPLRRHCKNGQLVDALSIFVLEMDGPLPLAR